eukprot:231587_1
MAFRKIKKSVTRHVVTRWYRGPEVILLQQKQATLSAVDMWSIGAIFAELLQMIKENVRNYKRRKPLFPGNCSLLSPRNAMHSPSKDQLSVIFNIIGTPTPEDLINIKNENGVQYLKKFRKQLPAKLEEMFIGTALSQSEKKWNSLSLLRGFLQFDVEKRITIDEALRHPYINVIRDEENEKEFEKLYEEIKYRKSDKSDIHFEFEDVQNMSMCQYRKLIIEEIQRYNV